MVWAKCGIPYAVATGASGVGKFRGEKWGRCAKALAQDLSQRKSQWKSRGKREGVAEKSREN